MPAKNEKVDIWSEDAVSETPKHKGKKQSKEENKKPQAEVKKPSAEKKKIAKKVEEKKEKIAALSGTEKTATGLELSEVIVYPLISEKAVGSIEKENKITFIVNQKATKNDVRTAVEKLYAVKVDAVNVLRDSQGRKKAIVRIDKKFKAQELATKLGVI